MKVLSSLRQNQVFASVDVLQGNGLAELFIKVLKSYIQE